MAKNKWEKILYLKLLFGRKIHGIGSVLVLSYLPYKSQEKFLFYCDLLEASSHPIFSILFLSFLFYIFTNVYTLRFYKIHKIHVLRNENRKKEAKGGKKMLDICVEAFSTLPTICVNMFSLFEKLKLFHLTSFWR